MVPHEPMNTENYRFLEEDLSPELTLMPLAGCCTPEDSGYFPENSLWPNSGFPSPFLVFGDDDEGEEDEDDLEEEDDFDDLEDDFDDDFDDDDFDDDDDDDFDDDDDDDYDYEDGVDYEDFEE